MFIYICAFPTTAGAVKKNNCCRITMALLPQSGLVVYNLRLEHGKLILLQAQTLQIAYTCTCISIECTQATLTYFIIFVFKSMIKNPV